ncbi:MAG: hypothetical protein P1V35_07355 [Planctomycetota bacterium]|nr:hypothetical protein [Planctomycetota bacterium]
MQIDSPLRRVALVPFLLLGFAGGAMAQGNTCSNPQVITPGAYSGTALDGQFYFYAVDVPAGYVIDVEETLDSNHAVYELWDVSCVNVLNSHHGPGLNDVRWYNTTGSASQVVVNVWQFSSVGGSSTDYGFNLSVTAGPCPEDRLENNDSCAGAVSVQEGLYLDLFVAENDKDFYAFDVPVGATASIALLHPASSGNVDGFLRQAGSSACGTGQGGGVDLLASAETNQDWDSMDWTNTTGSTASVVLEVLVRDTAGFDCNTYDLILSGLVAPGTSQIGPVFCNPMDANSTGVPTRLGGHWGSGVGSDLHLDATSGPPNQIGYVLVGSSAAVPGIPISQGRLCMGTQSTDVLGRYNVDGGPHISVGMFDANGVLQNLVGTSASGSGFDVPSTLPIAGFPTIVSGSTWHFQLWHRENGGASNFSNGLSVTF